jgi:hypothetical protein
MTDAQYTRFTGLIKVLFDNFNPKKAMLKDKMVIVTITDSLGESIVFKLRKSANVSEKGLRMLIGNRLKDLEKINKRLDLDNKCDLQLKTVDKVQKKKQRPAKPFKKKFKKPYKKYDNKNFKHR